MNLCTPIEIELKHGFITLALIMI